MKAAVLVTFNPDPNELERTCEALGAQVDHLCVVDNGSSIDIDPVVALCCGSVIKLSTNLGIAAAQNKGLRAVIEEGAEFIVLSDQDSVMPPGAIDSLIEIVNSDPLCAAAVPMFRDDKLSAPSGFILSDSLFFTPSRQTAGQHDLLQAIASGMVINAKCLSEVGLMDEALFIDWVDIEWCWRARARGFRILGSADVVMTHNLGDMARNLGYRHATLRAPQRHYYITRNAFYLAFYSQNLSFIRRLVLVLRSLRYVIAFPILGSPTLANLKAVVIGVLHATLGRVGRYDLQTSRPTSKIRQ